ncbi:hypothetical protein HK101_004133, partial [Irineochytrium annulatum]
MRMTCAVNCLPMPLTAANACAALAMPDDLERCLRGNGCDSLRQQLKAEDALNQLWVVCPFVTPVQPGPPIGGPVPGVGTTVVIGVSSTFVLGPPPRVPTVVTSAVAGATPLAPTPSSGLPVLSPVGTNADGSTAAITGGVSSLNGSSPTSSSSGIATWAIVVIVLVILAVIAAATAFFYMRTVKNNKRKSADFTEYTGPISIPPSKSLPSLPPTAGAASSGASPPPSAVYYSDSNAASQQQQMYQQQMQYQQPQQAYQQQQYQQQYAPQGYNPAAAAYAAQGYVDSATAAYAAQAYPAAGAASYQMPQQQQQPLVPLGAPEGYVDRSGYAAAWAQQQAALAMEPVPPPAGPSEGQGASAPAYVAGEGA